MNLDWMFDQMAKEKINIAIDGYSSCGKSTLAKWIAKELHYKYIDTGAMYRAVTLAFMRAGVWNQGDLNEEIARNTLQTTEVNFVHNSEVGKSETYLNGENVEKEIRTLSVAKLVSKVSALLMVRTKLAALQKEMALEKGVVMDGRDIGTVIMPEAELKLFVQSNKEVRATRRYLELKERGEEISLDEVRNNIEERDILDTTRKENPLTQADDAIVLDNSDMTIQEQNQYVLELVQQILVEQS